MAALPALACAALAVLAVAGRAQAQTALVVNGVSVDGGTSQLVAGTTYAPAAALASALGAHFYTDADTTTATFQLGGHLVAEPVVTDPAKASATGGLTLDGRSLAGPAAVLQNGAVLVPVKPVAEALGGRVAYLQKDHTVVVVQPRAQLTAMTTEGSGAQQRLVLQVTAPVGFSRYYNQPIQTLQIHLDRTDVGPGVSGVVGNSFVRADANASGNGTDVRVQLAQNSSYQLYSLPDGQGFRLIVGFAAKGATSSSTAHIVLDPGHGGEDPGINFPGYGSEASLTLSFCKQLQKALQARGFDVTLTRTGDYTVSAATRSRDGVGADLFVSVQGAVLPAGQFNAYYLGDAGSLEALDAAIRKNAQSAVQRQDVSALRRKILLGLVPQLGVGRSFAEGLGSQLFQNGGYRANTTAGAPLYVLGGAAGRGVLLEFSPRDLASGSLPGELAGALAALLGSGGATQ